jgi:hypothetical protein
MKILETIAGWCGRFSVRVGRKVYYNIQNSLHSSSGRGPRVEYCRSEESATNKLSLGYRTGPPSYPNPSDYIRPIAHPRSIHELAEFRSNIRSF